MDTVWVDIRFADAPDLPHELVGHVETASPDPASWWLTSPDDLTRVRAFVAWRRGFLHTVELGRVDDVGVACAYLRRNGHEARLDEPGYLDGAALTSLWWYALDDFPARVHPNVSTVRKRLGAVAALARQAVAPGRFRLARSAWPVAPVPPVHPAATEPA